MRSISLLMISLSVFAANSYACPKESLAHFISGGQEVPSQMYGGPADDSDSCDGFGGNFVHTPENKFYVNVNFNNPGTIDLDAMDKAYDTYRPSNPDAQQWLLHLSYVVVTKDYIQRRFNDPREMILNFDHTILFISGKILEEGRFNAAMEVFFNPPPL